MIQPEPQSTGLPRRMRAPVSDAQLRDLAKAYAGGASIRALVSDTGMAYGTVHRRLHLAAQRGMTTIRPKGGVRTRPVAGSSS